MTGHPSGGRTALYRLFNAEGDLLYVGISWQPLPSRMNGHAGTQPWWGEVDHATAVWYPTREDADQAETEAIKVERPKYNIAKTAPPRPRSDVRKPRPPADHHHWPSDYEIACMLARS